MTTPNITRNMGLRRDNSAKNVGTTGWIEIYNILKELFITSFKWDNLPPTINQRFLELSLFDYGKVAFFEDAVIGHLALKVMLAGKLDVYYEPTTIEVYGGNGYNARRKNNINAIIIYNNFVRDTPQIRIMDYAKRIYQIEKTIDINVHAQRTPIMIKTSKKQELTVKQLYQQYDDFKPVVVVDEEMDLTKLGVINTQAPFIARDLMDLKKQIWNEALSYIGIENNSAEKSERLTKDEISVSNGLAVASRNSKLQAREYAVDKINMMFGLNIEVDINNESILENPLSSEGGSESE